MYNPPRHPSYRESGMQRSYMPQAEFTSPPYRETKETEDEPVIGQRLMKEEDDRTR
jgi:hypothetical protein